MSWAGVCGLESSSESPHLERDVRDLDRPRRPVVSSTASCVVVEQLLHQVDVSSTYRKTLQHLRGKPHFGTYLRRCDGTHRAREALPPRLRGPPEPRGTARAPPGGAGCGRRAHGSVPGRFGAVLSSSGSKSS